MAAEAIEEREISIWDHISELRSRLLKAIAALVITTVACVAYLAPILIAWLAAPADEQTQ